jgi:hypothetical protein
MQNDVQVIIDEIKAFIVLGDLESVHNAFDELCDALGVKCNVAEVDAIVDAIRATQGPTTT